MAGESETLGASPDGKYLVYQSSEGGDTELFRLNWSDGEKKRLTTGSDLDAAFSPDGEWVVFTRYDEDAALWKISIDGGEPVKLTNLPGMEHYPTVPPDGKRIAFIRIGSGKMSFPPMAVSSSEGGKIVKEFDGLIGNPPGHGKIALQWTPDGQALDYAVHRNGVSNIWRQPLDGSPPIF